MSRKKTKEVKTEEPEPQPRQPEAKAQKPLTSREEKAILIIAHDFERLKNAGEPIRPIRARYGDDFDITVVYRELKARDIDISTVYRFDFETSAHVFQLQLLHEQRKGQTRTRTTPQSDRDFPASEGWKDFGDLFDRFFGKRRG